MIGDGGVRLQGFLALFAGDTGEIRSEVREQIDAKVPPLSPPHGPKRGRCAAGFTEDDLTDLNDLRRSPSVASAADACAWGGGAPLRLAWPGGPDRLVAVLPWRQP